VVDDPATPESLRAVGQAITQTKRRSDGWVELSSTIWFDSAGLLMGTSFATKDYVKIEVLSTSTIDPSGNLHSFDARVKTAIDPDEVLRLEGRLKQGAIEVTARSPLPILNFKRSFAYKPRSLVQNALAPIDRIPGLQVGQRWEMQVVSPLTGRNETIRAEVARRHVIHWDKSPVTTLEVVHHMTPLTVKTWVRPDGLVLRQELPFPFVKLLLERLPDRAAAPNSEVSDR
jgi:hypothetical protein